MKLLPQFTETGLDSLIGYCPKDEPWYEILNRPHLVHGMWTCLVKGWFGLAFIELKLIPK